MSLLEALAESKIQEAQRRGLFDDLAGSGQPIDFSIDDHVPSEVRAIYRVMKAANMLPPEVVQHQALHKIEQLLHAVQAQETEVELWRTYRQLQLSLSLKNNTLSQLHTEQAYFEKLVRRLADT